MFQLNHVLIAEPRWLYYVSAVAKVVEHPIDCNRTLDRWRPAACLLGAPVVKCISLALSIVSVDHLLWLNHVWLSGCSLITNASYWLWTLIVEFFLCFSGPWTQGFIAGWFSRAGYLLSHRPGLSQEIKTFQDAKKGQILAVDHCMRWHLCWQAFMALSEIYTWIEAYTSCWYL